jgi:hypothetical protein
MAMQQLSLPVTMPHLHMGFGEGMGVVIAGQDQLVLEYQVRDSVLNVLKSALKTVTVPYGEIAEISFQKGWGGGGVLEVRTHSLRPLSDVPSVEGSTLRLDVSKANRDIAAELVSIVMLRKTEERLREMTAQPDSPPQDGRS